MTKRIHSFLEQKAENASPAELELERSIESLLADDCDDVNDYTSEESLSDSDHYYIVKPFPGATVSDMEDFSSR